MKRFLGILLAALLVFSLGVPAVMAGSGGAHHGNGDYYNDYENGYDDDYDYYYYDGNDYDDSDYNGDDYYDSDDDYYDDSDDDYYDDGDYNGDDYYDGDYNGDDYYDGYDSGDDDYYGEAAFDIWGLVPEDLLADLEANTTRAEFAALAVMLYELIAGEEIVGLVEFYDTGDINVGKAAYIEVVMGMGDGTFAPDAYLTREQAAVMLVRLANAIGTPLPEADYADFADADYISGWAFDAVSKVQAGYIMLGVGDGMFDPQGLYTRGQSIATIERLHGWIMGTAETEEYNGYDDVYGYDVYGYEEEYEYNGYDAYEYNGYDEYEENGYDDEYNGDGEYYNGEGDEYNGDDDAGDSDDEYNGEE